ncbi:MAG: hypothetical protein J3Q66DRAFT_415289 [Benniella sp.]|nr:MAG: hypothetical protein J3Q66DRAFT_415289 [Benniella sp.]
MPSSHLSIIDIPHIVDAISDHLSSKDIWCCYRVNRTWSQAFNFHRYKFVRFAYLDPYQTWNILHNAHMIRNLTVDLADAGYFLDARCTRLKSLICNNMGYTETTNHDNEWAEYAEWMPVTRTELDPTINALSLISRNPELEQLTVDHHHLNCPQPFSPDILTALSLHQSLRTIYINLRTPMRTFAALLKHLPRMLQELSLVCIVEYEWDDEYLPAIELTHPTRLRRFVSLGRIAWPDRHLIPLLKQSPWLEEIILDDVLDIRDVTAAIVECCPRLNLLDLTIANSDIGYVDTLVRAYPMGLRSLTLGYLWGSRSGEPNAGNLIEALSVHSSNTLEVLKVSHGLHNVVHDITAVLEGFPNLKELEVTCQSSFLLDDIVHQTSWSESSLWETDPSTGSTESSLILPWACTQLETLTLFIGNIAWGWCVSPERLQETHQEDVKEEEAISVARKIGVLWNTLKSLKSLKTLSLHWSHETYQKIMSMSFDRAVLYMKQIGLPEMTQQEAAWMGLEWTSIVDHLKSEESSKLRWAACHDRSGFAGPYDSEDILHKDQDEYQAEGYEDFSELDWEIGTNNKKIHKSMSWYSRRSLRNRASWFES